MATGTVTDGIRSLSREDLEVLLARRPEAVAVLDISGTRASVALLASALAGRAGVRRAVESLDFLLLQLLRLAAWLGTDVPARDLTAQAAGVDPGRLREAAAELARWGLAFPHPAARSAGGWRLAVPGAVRGEVPPALGRRAAELLGGEPAESIRAILIRLGAEAPRPATRDVLLGLLTRLLGDRAVLDRALERGPASARAVLDTFAAAGGTLTWEEMPRHGVRFGMPSGTRDDPGAGLAWLRQAGLLVVTAPGPWQPGAGLSIPGEAQLALRDGVVFPNWEPDPPPVEAVPLPRGTLGAGDATGLVAAVQALLDEWAHRPPKAVQKGGAGVRDVRRVAKSIGVDERHGQFLYAVAVEARLLEYREDHVVPSARAAAWTDAPAPQQWRALFEAWLEAGLWVEPDGLVGIDDAPYGDGIPRARRAVLAILAGVPAGYGSEPGAVARRLWWDRPLRGAPHAVMQTFVEGVGEALGRLGCGTGGGPGEAVALLEPARSALADPGWAGTAAAEALFPHPVSTLTVQPDLTVLVPGRPAAALSRTLARFAELQASSPARIYRITDASLRAALDAGMEPAAITAFLEEHARSALPQSVRFLVDDVGRQHGRLIAGRAGLFVRSDDASLVAAVVADRRLTRLRPRALAPTVVVFAESDLGKLLKALRAAGYMPVAEAPAPDAVGDEGIRLGWGLRHRDGQPILHRHRFDRGPGVDRERIAAVAAAVAAEAARVPVDAALPFAPVDPLLDGRLCRLPREIRRLVALAVEHSAALEVQYVSGSGETSVRTIEPVETDATSVTARCRLRDDVRTFWVSRIRWGRATGETFEPDAAELLPPAADTRTRRTR